MQGRITRQLPSDGDAKELIKYLHIDKKIIPGEPPFDIPENWIWLPVGYLGASTDTDSFCDGPFGSNLKTTHQIPTPEVRIIQLSNIGEDGWKDKNVKYTSFKHLEEVIPRCEVHPGDFVIAKMMPAGRTIIVPDLKTRIALGSDAMKFVPNSILNKQYLLYVMRSQAFLGQVYAEAHGITRVRTTLNCVKSYVLPIPPLEEQKRIVTKLEDILPLINRYEAAWNNLEAFNKRFPVDMQKSILQMAIQGKLVEQRPEEGTGEELYRQIQSEKQALVKAGKIKKEKPLPVIAEDEIPFDIPDNWKWVRLRDIISVLGDGIHGTPVFDDTGGYYFVNGNNLVKGKIVFKSDTKKVSIDEYEKHKKPLDENTILISINGTIGNYAFYAGEPIILGKSACYFSVLTGIDKEYIRHLINTKFFMDYAVKEATQTTIKNVSLKAMRMFPVPLPPFAEQKRIVAKLEEILPLCEQLK